MSYFIYTFCIIVQWQLELKQAAMSFTGNAVNVSCKVKYHS